MTTSAEMTPQESFMGKTCPDPIGAALKTNYMRFKRDDGIQGLATWSEQQLSILAIVSNEQGIGKIRAFIEQAKQLWPSIAFAAVWNDTLKQALQRYGFKEGIIEMDKEKTDAWIWTKD